MRGLKEVFLEIYGREGRSLAVSRPGKRQEEMRSGAEEANRQAPGSLFRLFAIKTTMDSFMLYRVE